MLVLLAVLAPPSAAAPQTYVVNSTGDAGDTDTADGICNAGGTNSQGDVACTLRAAMEQANASTDTDTIVFDMPTSEAGHNAGVWTIAPATNLPAITATVSIDGSTQSGYVANTAVAPAPLNGTQVVEIRPTSTLVEVIFVDATAPATSVHGLVVNENRGIRLDGTGSTITGSYIGTDPSGTVARVGTNNVIHALGNAMTIGGLAPADRNLIVANSALYLSGSSNTVQGNLIGTDVNASSILSGADDGIIVRGSNNLIGGDTASAANVIRGFGTGVAVDGGTGSAILGNRIFDNIAGTWPGLGIDLSAISNPDGPTPNDAGDSDTGSNDYLNHPVITFVTGVGATVTVGFDLDAPAGDYRIEAFTNPSGADPSGYGEGEVFEAATTITHTGTGSESFQLVYTGLVNAISLTATEDLGAGVYGSTSEFSATAVVSPPTVATVNSTGDASDTNPGDGVCDTGATNSAGATECTLRAAIEEANASASIDTIEFDIPNSDPNHLYFQDNAAAGLGTPIATTLDDASITDFDPDYPVGQFSWWNIQVTGNLPNVNGGITIDGSTQPGWKPNTATGGAERDAVLPIVINSDGAYIMNLEGDNSVVRGLNFSGASSGGSDSGTMLYVDGNNISVDGSWFMVDPVGLSNGPGDDGIWVVTLSTDVTVGGPNPEDHVLIGNGLSNFGLALISDSSTLENIWIGSSVTGDALLPEQNDISLYVSGNDNVVRDVVVSSSLNGLLLVEGDRNTVQASSFGYLPDGTPSDNEFSEVEGSDNVIGGVNPGDGNAFRGADNVLTSVLYVSGGTGNSVLGNTFTGTRALNLDIAPNGVNLNDAGDGDTGDNDLLNHPEVTLVTPTGATATVDYSLDVPAGTYRIEFYADSNEPPPGSGFGAGESAVGSDTITHTGSGVETFSATIISIGDYRLAATATEDLGGGDFGSTSEFGPTFVVFPPTVATVNSTGDASDTNPGDGVCDTGATNSAGATECTLRAAIEEANASASIDTIEFDMPTSEAGHNAGVWTISPLAELPIITAAMSVDGTTQAGFIANTNPAPLPINWTQVIMIDGGSAPSGARALWVQADDVSISGLTIGNFQWASGYGLEIDGNNTLVTATAIGVDPAGTTAAPIAYGIYATGDGITIGGTSPGDRNLITGADNGQINVQSVTNSVIDGNLIGTNVDADALLAPFGTGIEAWSGSGIQVGSASAGNVIGGSWGFEFSATDSVIENNLIGTNATHTADLGDWQGIGVFGANNTIVDNVIGNWQEGIVVADTNTEITGNFIGTDPTLTANIGNSSLGVRITNAATSARVGGATANTGNTIVNNGGAAISSAATTVTILGNAISENVGIGIDVLEDGPTANSGADLVLNHPVISSIIDAAGTITVNFDLDAPAGDYRIEAFTNPSGADPSGYGEGEVFEAATTITHTGTGSESFQVSFSGTGEHVSLTATVDGGAGAYGATSEFSPTVSTAPSPGIVVVNSTGDSSDTNPGDGVCDTGATNSAGATECTLRAAIEEANARAGLDTVEFAIPTTETGHDAGVWTISPTAGYDNISDAIVIDGSTQPGFASTPTIQLDGTSAGTVDALRLVPAGSGSTIRSLAIGNFSQSAIDITGDANLIVGNHLGLDASGIVSENIGNSVVLIDGGVDNVIGGTLPGSRNLIGASNNDGIEIRSSSTTGTLVQNNWIGIGSNGAHRAPMGGSGISIVDASDATILDNAIGNADYGVEVAGTASDVTIRGNTIGVDSTTLNTHPTSFGSIIVTGAVQQVSIGGTSPGDGNYIRWAIDHRPAVYVSGSNVDDVSILGNTILTDELAIDLGGDGYTPNDPLDVDGGPNDYMNHPTPSVTSFSTTDGTNYTIGIDVELDVPAGNYRIEIYTNDSVSFGGAGALQTLAHGFTVTHLGAGPQTFSTTYSSTFPQGTSATVTEDFGGGVFGSTSEVSPAAVIGVGTAVVNSTADTADADLSDRVCDTGALNSEGQPECTLRAALEETNRSGASTIAFDIPTSDPNYDASGYWTISQSRDYEDIRSATTIDGSTQPGFDGSRPVIFVDDNLGGTNHLTIAADDVTLRSLSLGHAGDDGVEVDADRARLDGLWIGIDPAGNDIGAAGSGREAIIIYSGADDLIIENSRLAGFDTGVTSNSGTMTATITNTEIFNNRNSGIVFDNSGTISLLGNSIYDNAGLGFELTNNDRLPLPNDAGDADSGPNGRLNYPELSLSSIGAGTLDIDYDLDVPAGTYRVEFFDSDRPDATLFGEGQRFLSAESIVHPGGSVAYSTTLVGAPGDVITATATLDLGGGAYGGTSEFSNALTVGQLYVNSTGDTGDILPGDGLCATGATNSTGAPECTLRAAIEESNASPSIASIVFAIPDTDAGHDGIAGTWTIAPAIALPPVTLPLTIDAMTQPTAVPNTNPAPLGLNGSLVVELDGSAAGVGANGLHLQANTSIRGLVINSFSGDAILVDTGADSSEIVGNYLGLTDAGATAAGNGDSGVDVGASDVTIGGALPADRNLISASNRGIRLETAGVTGTTIEGNLIGTDVSGLADLGSAQSAIRVWAADGTLIRDNVVSGNGTGTTSGIDVASVDGTQILNNFVGVGSDGLMVIPNARGIEVNSSTNTIIDGNVVSGNADTGISVQNGEYQITGNSVGVDAAGNAAGNGASGIAVLSGDGSTIGGTTAGSQNEIAFNATNGITVTASSAVSIIENAIYDNGALSIDINDDGVTANDSPDIDGVVNYPVITDLNDTAGTTTASFDLDVPAGDYRIEFFSTSTADPSGHGEAETALSSTTITHLGTGVESFSHTITAIGGDLISATATEIVAPVVFGGTSEVSLTVRVNTPPVFDTDIASLSHAEGSSLSEAGSATDADLDVLLYSAVGLPAGITYDAATGVLSGTVDPTAAAGSPYAVTLTVDDGNGGIDTDTFTWTITNTNQAPAIAAITDTSVDELSPIGFTASVIDPDLPADTITFSATGLPAGATLEPTSGAFSWTPTETQGPGSYTITITATDDGTPALSDSTTFTITVNEVAATPVLAPIGNQTSAESGAVTVAPSATDADIPTDTLLWSATNLPTGLTINPTTGLISGTVDPTAGANSPYTTTITVDDQTGNTASETFTWTITNTNRNPTLDPIADATITETDVFSLTAIATDPDLPADTITYSATGLPAGATINPTSGALTINPNETNGPASYAITITATDSGTPPLADSSPFTLTINEVNTAPALALLPNRSVDEDSPITIAFPATDVDRPNNTLTYSATGLPTGAVFDAVAGTLTWTPTEADGPASLPITVTVSDDGAPSLSDTATFTLTVNDVNQPPVMLPRGGVQHAEGEAVSFSAVATDSDLPADTLSYIATGLPQGLSINSTTGRITGVLPYDASESSPYLVTVTASDGRGGTATASFDMAVDNTNRAPTLNPIPTTTVNELSTLSVVVTASDPDNNDLVFSLSGAPGDMTIDPNSGEIRWFATEDDGETNYIFTVIVTDTDPESPLSASQAVTVSINELNNAPTLAEPSAKLAPATQEFRFGLTAVDVDRPGDTLRFSVIEGPEGLVIDRDTGLIRWTPDIELIRSIHDVTVQVSDDGSPSLSDRVTFTIEVLPPSLAFADITASGDSFTVPFDTATRLDVLDNDDGNELSITATTRPEDGVVSVTDGAIRFTPTRGFVGVTSFEYTIASSDGGSATAAVTVIVDPPDLVATDDEASGTAGEAIVIDVLLNDVTESSIVDITAGDPANGSVERNSTGGLSYLPDDDFRGTDQFLYTITDSFGTTRSATVRITVIGPALTPTAQSLVDFDIPEPEVQVVPPAAVSIRGLAPLIMQAIRALQLPTQLVTIAGVWLAFFVLGIARFQKRPTIHVVNNVDRFETVPVYATDMSKEIFRLRYDADLVYARGRRVRRKGTWYRRIESPAGPGLVEDRYLTDMAEGYLGLADDDAEVSR